MQLLSGKRNEHAFSDLRHTVLITGLTVTTVGSTKQSVYWMCLGKVLNKLQK